MTENRLMLALCILLIVADTVLGCFGVMRIPDRQSTSTRTGSPSSRGTHPTRCGADRRGSCPHTEH